MHSRLVVWLIRKYQEHLSPRKGYLCAYRGLNGGPSCSEHALALVAAGGIWGSIFPMGERLRQCRQAALAAKKARIRLRRRRGKPFDPNDPDMELPRASTCGLENLECCG